MLRVALLAIVDDFPSGTAATNPFFTASSRLGTPKWFPTGPDLDPRTGVPTRDLEPRTGFPVSPTEEEVPPLSGCPGPGSLPDLDLGGFSGTSTSVGRRAMHMQQTRSLHALRASPTTSLGNTNQEDPKGTPQLRLIDGLRPLWVASPVGSRSHAHSQSVAAGPSG